jgi:hypothetical protein
MGRKRKGSPSRDERVDEIAAQLDDVGMMIDEVAADPASPGARDRLRDARKKIERAVDAVDDLADSTSRRPRR